MSSSSHAKRASDLVSAALRHVGDAHEMLDSSPDQSWHLAGFGPECIRKACLREAWLDRTLGHDLTEAGEAVLSVALALDSGAARYPVSDMSQRFPVFSDWRPDCRYEPTGTRETDAQELVRVAKNMTEELAAELWMDGRIGWLA